MAPKNKKKNSFYFFMKEMQEREAAKGRRISINDMPHLAHPLWAQLSIVQREPYEEMAQRFKNDPSLRGGKLASDGTRVEDNLREELEKERLENAMKQAIKAYVNIGCVSEQQFIDYVSRKVFYFISFNILCHTDTEYIPNEVGLVEYSLQHGIIKEYHTLMYTGPIPTGYAGEAMRLSEEKHGIDIFDEKCAEKDLRLIYRNIKRFVNPHDSDEYPPLFTVEDDLVQTRGCMNYLADRSRDRDYFEVWNTKYLLLELRAGAGHPLPSAIIASDLLNKTSFNYHPAARCEFHDEKDIHCCALAYSKQLCYLLSDATCLLFNIELTEKHMPARAVEDKEYVITMSDDVSRRYKPLISPITSRLDLRSNYYENTTVQGQFFDAQQNDVNSQHKIQDQVPSVPRQPASNCIAAEMSRLKLNMTAASVPGHGIGRGQRRTN